MPVLELVQPAELLQYIQPGAHPQVKRIAEDDLCAHFVQAARHHALDGAVGAYGHEDRGLHHAVAECQAATAGLALGAVGRKQVKLQHGVIVGKGAGVSDFLCVGSARGWPFGVHPDVLLPIV